MFSKNLKNLRKRLGISQEQLAQRLGISDKTISSWEIGRTEPNMGMVQRIADMFSISTDELIKDDTAEIRLPKAEPVVELNIYDPLSCGTGGFVEDNVVAVITLPLSMIPKNKKDLFGQYAVGDSMIGKNIHDGDLLVFNREQCESGDVGCFCIDENIATCKTLRIVGDQIMLLPANDKYEPIVVSPELFRCVGKLVLVVSRVE